MVNDYNVLATQLRLAKQSMAVLRHEFAHLELNLRVINETLMKLEGCTAWSLAADTATNPLITETCDGKEKQNKNS
tara:strand:- start:550 stop:777 length:228 start_codon:yes stop_codon:yes gene_type:complete